MFLYDEIHDMLANVIIAQFLFLESEDPDKEIMVYINSPGGVVTSGLAIHDTMQYVRCDVSTTCLGMAASMAAVLLAAGTKGRRNALPNARVMIHQPMGGARGQASDIEIQAREIRHLKDVLTDILANATGKAQGPGPQGHRPRLLPQRRSGEGVRAHRQRHAPPEEARRRHEGEVSGSAGDCGLISRRRRAARRRETRGRAVHLST